MFIQFSANKFLGDPVILTHDAATRGAVVAGAVHINDEETIGYIYLSFRMPTDNTGLQITGGDVIVHKQYRADFSLISKVYSLVGDMLDSEIGLILMTTDHYSYGK